jgi:hypothetical protein
MNTSFIRFLMLIATAVVTSAVHLGATAQPLAQEEADEIRGVIVAQLEAFADDDADTAFEIATPAVRQAIGSSSRFLAMVRGAYPMVYRPASVSFHKPEQEAGSVLQLVEITDSESKSWLALYALERQPDMSWRISGCVVKENNWKAV